MKFFICINDIFQYFSIRIMIKNLLRLICWNYKTSNFESNNDLTEDREV